MDPTGTAEIVPATEQESRAKPRHHFFAEVVQFRAKVQSFTHSPAEVTIQKIDFGQEQRRYLMAAEHGQPSVRQRRYGPIVRPEVPNPENRERAVRRAKSTCRRTIMELAPSAMVTFTTRGNENREDMRRIWHRFWLLATVADPDFVYVAVPEPHPSNPDHYHLHVAVRTSMSIKTLRRLWHIAILQHRGLPRNSPTRGADSPGNIDVQAVRGKDQNVRIAKIARYLTKYLTKSFEDEVHFGRKRYWVSRGIVVAAAAVFWLSSLNQLDAITEALQLLGGSGTADELVRLRPFMPETDRVAWFVLDPAKLDPPPF